MKKQINLNLNNMVVGDQCFKYQVQNEECHEIVFECIDENLQYCFPGREFIVSMQDCDIVVPHSYFFPISFISIVKEIDGIPYCYTLLASTPKISKLRLYKKGHIIRVHFFYEPCKNKTIQIECNIQQGDFHKGIEYYKNWYQKHVSVDMQQPFAGCFHLKRMFFYDTFCESSMIQNEQICLNKIVEQDKQQLGGVDIALLFDYAYDKKKKIRCGNQQATQLTKQQRQQFMKQMQETNIKYFHYYDPYIIEKDSDWDQMFQNQQAMKTKDGIIFHNWQEQFWHPCLHQTYIQDAARTYIIHLQESMNVCGMYLDEIGNGMQYPYYIEDKTLMKINQNHAEQQFIDAVQDTNEHLHWMCEFPVVEELVHKFQIVLSDTRSLVNIYRFIFPWVKYIRIIGCDLPLGNNPWEVNKSFFNGEGLWLDNDSNNEQWYPENIKKRIREQYAILCTYKEYFDSLDVEACIDVKSNVILCNKFCYENNYVCTLINPSGIEEVATVMVEKQEEVNVIYGDCIIDFEEHMCKIHVPSQEVIAILVKKVM